LRKGDVPATSNGTSLDEIMANFEKDVIVSALEQCHYNLTRTAEQLEDYAACFAL